MTGENEISRRQFMGRLGAYLAIANIAGWGLLGWDNKRREHITVQNYGRYLSLDDGGFRLADEPTILQVTFIPSKNKLSGQEEIILNRAPHLSSPQQRINFKETNIGYAVPVFGEPYGSPLWKYSGISGGMSLTINYNNGERILGGQWMMTTDKDGNPVNPQGQRIDPKAEKPFYTTNDYSVLA